MLDIAVAPTTIAPTRRRAEPSLTERSSQRRTCESTLTRRRTARCLVRRAPRGRFSRAVRVDPATGLGVFSLRLMRHRSVFALLAAVAGLTGCGGGARTMSQTRKPQALFDSNCSACHSLIGNESRRRQGGDLVGYRFTRSQLLEFTREMPTRRALTSSELNTIVDYVLEIEQHRPAH